MIRRKKFSSISKDRFSKILAKNFSSSLKIDALNKFLLSQRSLSKEITILKSSPEKVLGINSQKTKFKFSSSQVNIVVSQELPFVKNRRVERLGRHNWRGTITAIEDEMAYVNWGFCRTWISISELYPLDSRDNPYFSPKNPNLIEIARRARINLRPLRSNTPPEITQGTLFN